MVVNLFYSTDPLSKSNLLLPHDWGRPQSTQENQRDDLTCDFVSMCPRLKGEQIDTPAEDFLILLVSFSRNHCYADEY